MFRFLLSNSIRSITNPRPIVIQKNGIKRCKIISKSPSISPSFQLFSPSFHHKTKIQVRWKSDVEENKSIQVSNPPLSSPHEYLLRAKELTKNGIWSEAIQDLSKVLEVQQMNLDARILRGVSYQREKQYQDAVGDYMIALTLEPTHVEVVNNLAICYKFLKNTTLAMEHFDRAIQLNPNHLSSLGHRGDFLFGLGRYDEAIRDYEKVLKMDASNPLALSGMGRAFLSMGEYSNAKSYYMRLAKIQDLQFLEESLNGMALSDYHLGNHKEAVEGFTHVLSMEDEPTADSLTLRGYSYLALGDLKNARKDLEEAHAREPDNLLTMGALGQMNSDEGEWEAAIKLLEVFYEGSKGNTSRSSAEHEAQVFASLVKSYSGWIKNEMNYKPESTHVFSLESLMNMTPTQMNHTIIDVKEQVFGLRSNNPMKDIATKGMAVIAQISKRIPGPTYRKVFHEFFSLLPKGSL